jgi:hypothetical protein
MPPAARYPKALSARRARRGFRRMLYSILIYVAEDVVDAMTPADEEDHISRHLKIHEQLAAKGKLGPVVRLMPTTTAKQLRTNGTNVVVDGPFAETKEQLLGFYVVDCANQEEAMAVARSLPSVGTIFEIRPVQLFFPGVGLPKTAVERVRS